MSVVVRMEMPTSCEKCPACDYEEGNCLLADDRNTLPHNGKRREWCPILCELPEKHGDLIERAATMNAILGEPTDAHYPSWYAEIVNDIPTIVPAERSENK